MNSRPIAAARWRPRVVLPAPIMPTRKIDRAPSRPGGAIGVDSVAHSIVMAGHRAVRLRVLSHQPATRPRSLAMPAGIILLHTPRLHGLAASGQGLQSPLMKSTNTSSKQKAPAGRSWLTRLFLKAAVLFAGLGLCGALLMSLALALAWPNLPDLSAMIDYRPRVPLRVYTADKV